MFRFEHEFYLYGLLLIPLFILVFTTLMIWRQRALQRFGESSLVAQLAPDSSKGKHIGKFICALLAFTFFILALANPQIGKKLKKAQRKGIDIFFALDVSRSMLAEDIKPNRLKRAKRAIGQVIDQLGTDRVGLVVYAGDAYLQLPLTTDFSAAKMFLETVNPKIVPQQGTAIGDAITRAQNGFEEEEDKYKALVILSDGENWQGDAVNAAQKAADKGIKIYTIGMGTTSGGPIPIKKRNSRYDFHHNKQGEVVVTKLEESTLKKIAQAGQGEYIHYSGGRNDLQNILEALGKMEKKKYEEKVYTDYADKFQYCIGLGLLFLIIEFFISERRSQWFNSLFKNETT